MPMPWVRFVFLDHLMPAKHSPNEPLKVVDGSGAHPHRGIAALTYIVNGEARTILTAPGIMQK